MSGFAESPFLKVVPNLNYLECFPVWSAIFPSVIYKPDVGVEFSKPFDKQLQWSVQ